MGQLKAKTMIERAGFKDDDLRTPEHDRIMLWLDSNIEDVIAKKFPEAWPNNEVEQAQRDFQNEMTKCRYRVEEEIRGIQASMQRLVDIKAQREAKGLETVLQMYRHEPDYESQIVKANENLKTISSWMPLEQPPPRPISEVLQKHWEYPIVNNNSYTIGFVDMMVKINKPSLWVTYHRERECYLPSSKPEWRIIYDNQPVYFEIKSKIPSLGELVRQIRFYQTYKQGYYFVVSPDDKYVDVLKSQGIGFVVCPSFSTKPIQTTLF